MSRATETAVLLEELLQPSHGGPAQMQRLLNFIGWGGPQSKDPSAIRIGVLGASQVGETACYMGTLRESECPNSAVDSREHWGIWPSMNICIVHPCQVLFVTRVNTLLHTNKCGRLRLATSINHHWLGFSVHVL